MITVVVVPGGDKTESGFTEGALEQPEKIVSIKALRANTSMFVFNFLILLIPSSFLMSKESVFNRRSKELKSSLNLMHPEVYAIS
jgi:hypothetical protein